jgi:UDP-glucose 4-epimerase
VLFADATKIRRELSWVPHYTDIEAIIATAWRWFKEHPHGYVD